MMRGLHAGLRALSIAALMILLCTTGEVAVAQGKVAATAADLSRLVDGVGGIEWRWSPRETRATLKGKDTPQPVVVWVGRIVDVRAGKAATGDNDSVVEFLAVYMPLAKPGPDALALPLRLRPESGDHFVVSLRSPAVSEEMLKNLRQSILDTTHYTVVLGEPKYIAPFGRWAAVWLQTRRASVSQQLKVEIVRE
jgi:hypothetical protein